MLLKTITENIIKQKYESVVIPTTFKIYSETLYGLSDIKYYYYCIYKNKLLSESTTNIIENVYVDSKNIINILNRFARKIKTNKYKKYEIDRDLRFILFKNYEKKEILQLIQYKTIYSFRILDLIHLLKLSLYNCENMFPRPMRLKNPFTNIVFKKY